MGLAVVTQVVRGQANNTRRNPYEGDLNQVKYVGKYFTFYKFLDFVVKCAKVTFSGGQTNPHSESQVQKNFQNS